MVTKPPVTRVTIPSNKYTVGRYAPISQVSEHHAVGDASHVITKAKGAAIFSTTYTIAMSGEIFQLVDDKDTPYCDNDFRSNSRSITIEHAGGLLPNYPYTEAMYQSSIKLHAWFFQTYGDLNCVRHRDIPEIKADPSKATACPGQLDVERIVNEAKGLLVSKDALTREEVILTYYNAYQDEQPSEEYIKSWTGKPYSQLAQTIHKDGTWLKRKQEFYDGRKCLATSAYEAVNEQLFRKKTT